MTDVDDVHSKRTSGRGSLSYDRIVVETLALIDEQGIAMASMRSVGARLGVRGMSLYRYVSGREELFDAVVEHVVEELASDPEVKQKADDGWRDYLERLARGVRRYAQAHPHAFPLVATRPSQAPWINPPLRSLRWVESMLEVLAGEGFTDDQVLLVYRGFNSFLLGYLLLETSAMALRDPKPGDGSFQTSSEGASDSADSADSAGRATPRDPADSADPVPGGLTPTRTPDERAAIDDATTATEQIDPLGDVDAATYPVIHRLRAGLVEDRYDEEFALGLSALLDRVQIALSADA